MPLPSFLQRKPASAPKKKGPAAERAIDSAAVEAVRTRARRRLIGAVVLLAVGIIGFPLVFETRPRPIALDIPIDGPVAAAASAAPGPSSAPAPARHAPAPTPPAPAVKAPPPTVITESAADAGRDVPAPAAKPTPAPVAADHAAAPAAPPPTAKADDGARAKALLNGTPAAAGERYVVQAGAYSDSSSLRAVRQKLEKLGLKTYTQVVQTPAGARTRVRVGPFASRDDAEHAAAKLRNAGLAAAILTL